MILNLGELYYYDKVLDDQGKPISELDILGIDLNKAQEGVSTIELLNKSKDEFIDKYSEILKENGLLSVNYIWNKITDVFLVSGRSFNSETSTDDNLLIGILNLLNRWGDQGQKIEGLGEILKEIEIISSNSLKGFSLYYGLRVLYTISKLILLHSNIDVNNLESSLDKLSESDPFELNYKNIILGICPPSLSGLFNSSGIETITNIDNIEKLINAIEGFIQKNVDTKLLITLGIDASVLEKIEKRFSGKLIVCPIPESVSKNTKDNYFAKLALKTIGLPELALKG